MQTIFFKETSKWNIYHGNLCFYYFLKICQGLKVLHGIMWQLHAPGGHNEKEILASYIFLLKFFAGWKSSLQEKLFLMFSTESTQFLNSLLLLVCLEIPFLLLYMALCACVSGILMKAACENFCTASSIRAFRDLLPFLKYPLSQRMLQVKRWN